MRRWLSVRLLFVACALGALVFTAFFAYHAAPNTMRTQLAGRLDPDALDSAVSAARQAILIGSVLASFATVFLGLILGGIVAQPLIRLRRAAMRLSRGARRTRRTHRIAEIDGLARAVERAGVELDARIAGIAHERDETARLLDSVGDGILQLAPDGRIARVNRASRDLLGLPDGVEGQRVSAYVRQARVRRALVRAARGGRVESREVRLDDRSILLMARPLESDRGNGGAVVLFVDLTEIRRLEGVRRDFVANASHELKTPLTSIRGYAETLLESEPEPEVRQRFLETIHDNADRLHRIVEDLLDLSRLESGGWRLTPQPLDIGEVAGAMWKGFAVPASEKGVAFRIDDRHDAPVPTDRIALRQIFSNLFDNALRHTEEGDEIVVRLYPADRDPLPQGPDATGPVTDTADVAAGLREGGEVAADGGGRGPWVIVEVADTGAGIPRDALGRIFERFYRVDPARSRREGGTGLGLAIVKHLAERLGGRIGVESRFGEGTVLRIALPATAE